MEIPVFLGGFFGLESGRRRRRLGVAILSLLLLAGPAAAAPPPAAGGDAAGAAVPGGSGFPPNPLSIQARSGVLMDAATGRVLYAFNERERLQPASLAKIMTFELILEAVDKGLLSMDTRITVPESAWRLALDNQLSNMFIEVGDEVAVRDLLSGLMVSSGNDAALTLAEYRGGSEPGFVAMMNARARELGLRDTVFKNSHGLFAEGQFTTALDVALLARHVVSAHPEALKITARKEFTYGGIRQPNWNRLVLVDRRATGLKTGHLPDVGYHLAATAEDRGMSLIAVVLGTAGEDARVKEAQKLLNYGFNNFSTVSLDLKGEVPADLPVYKGAARRVPLVPARAPKVTVPRGREGEIRTVAEVPRYVVAPVRKGQSLGAVRVELAGEEVGRLPLEAGRDVPTGGFFRRLLDSVRLFFRSILGR